MRIHYQDEDHHVRKQTTEHVQTHDEIERHDGRVNLVMQTRVQHIVHDHHCNIIMRIKRSELKARHLHALRLRCSWDRVSYLRCRSVTDTSIL